MVRLKGDNGSVKLNWAEGKAPGPKESFIDKNRRKARVSKKLDGWLKVLFWFLVGMAVAQVYFLLFVYV